MKPLIRIGLVAALVYAFWNAARAGSPPIPANDMGGTFSGKIVLVFTDASARGPLFVLADARVQSVEGRQFLVGTGADTKRPEDWHAGRKICVAWSAVTAYMDMTPDEYARHCADAAAERERNGR